MELFYSGLIITVPATSKVIKEHVPLFKCALKVIFMSYPDEYIYCPCLDD